MVNLPIGDTSALLLTRMYHTEWLPTMLTRIGISMGWAYPLEIVIKKFVTKKERFRPKRIIDSEPRNSVKETENKE